MWQRINDETAGSVSVGDQLAKTNPATNSDAVLYTVIGVEGDGKRVLEHVDNKGNLLNVLAGGIQTNLKRKVDKVDLCGWWRKIDI